MSRWRHEGTRELYLDKLTTVGSCSSFQVLGRVWHIFAVGTVQGGGMTAKLYSAGLQRDNYVWASLSTALQLYTCSCVDSFD